MLFALFLILLFSSHIASLCAKKRGEIFICKFFNCAKADFKKGDWFYISFYIADLEWPARYSVRRALLKILKPASLGLSKMDSAQSVNNRYKKYPLFF